MTYVYIIAGAVLGAPLRYFVGARFHETTGSAFPWGTLAVNLTGCLVAGFLLTLAEHKDLLGRDARLFAVTGFLGSYTTFSAFGWESYSLLRGDEFFRGAANIVLSVAGGVGAVWVGSVAARWL